MARGKKTPPEVVYQIMTSWAVTDNFNETARELDLPITTIKKVVDENKDKLEFVELCTQKRKEFSVAASRIIKKALRPITWGSWDDALKSYAEYQLEADSLGDMWDKSAESRYRVPDWYREWGGTTAFNFGSLIPAMAAEYFSASAAPTGEAWLAKTALGGTAKTTAKAIAPKLIKPKVSDIAFGLSAAGSAAKAGYAQSGDVEKSLLYGSLNGLGEVATEKLFGGIGGVKGVDADDLIDLSKVKGISRIAKNKYGNKALSIGLEGVEEIIMSAADPALQKMTVNPKADWSSFKDTWSESALQGILLSSFSNAATFPIRKYQKTKAIRILNKNAEAINSMMEKDSDKFELLKNNATIEEIEERQKQIKVFRDGYAELAVEDVIANNPEIAEMVAKNITKSAESTTVPSNTTSTVTENTETDSVQADISAPVETVQQGTVATPADTTANEATVSTAVAPTNVFTSEADELASTEMPTVSVGDTFTDTKTGNTIRVVSRDAQNTTVEIDTGSKVETRVYTNKQADTLAVNDQYEQIATAEAHVESRAITLTRIGDFYSAFGEDAVELADKLGLKIVTTKRYGEPVQMVAFPMNKLEAYKDTLGNGYNIAVADTSKATSINSENMHITDENTPVNEGVTNTDVNTPEGELAEVVDAINETLLPDARENLLATVKKATGKDDMEVFAKQLKESYESNGTIGAISEYFVDGGKKVCEMMDTSIQAGDVTTETDTEEKSKTEENVETPLKSSPDNDIIEESIFENEVNEDGNSRAIADVRRPNSEVQEESGSVQERAIGTDDSGRRLHRRGEGRVESRTLKDVYELKEFDDLVKTVGNEITDRQSNKLIEQYRSDSRLEDGEIAYDIMDLAVYDMLTDENNELRDLFSDNIAEYFNSEIDVMSDITGAKVPTDILKATKNSVVKNEHGQLIPVYHGTGVKFVTFTPGDIGIHFGSYSQAVERTKAKEIKNPKYIKAYLNIKNPLIIDADFPVWNAAQMSQKLAELGVISNEQALEFVNAYNNIPEGLTDAERNKAYNEITKEKNAELRKILTDQDYDGIVYTNIVESGDGTSYIVFDNKQIFRAVNTNNNTYEGNADGEDASSKTYRNKDLKSSVSKKDGIGFVSKLKKSIGKIKQQEKVFSVTDESIDRSERPSQTIINYFNSIGNKAESPILGEVELNNRGAKTTVFHGISDEKLTAIAAIKDVIEKGIVVDIQVDWKERGYNTYIIAAQGEINQNGCIVGVVIKNYPQGDMGNKFYLHEVIKIGVDSDAAADKGVTDVNESAPIDNIILSQENDVVNTNNIQKNENYHRSLENQEETETATESKTKAEAPRGGTAKSYKAMAAPATPTENEWVDDDAATPTAAEDVPTLSELVKDIHDSFGITIKSGKVATRKASGIYKVLPEVIRTRISNDLPTVIHELGHHLNKKYKLENSPHIDEAEPLLNVDVNAYSKAELPGEMAAEFVRRYFKNPDAIANACPNLTKDFLSLLDKKDSKSVSRIAPRVNAYLSAESGDRYGATIVNSKQAKLMNKEDLSDLAHDIYTKWIDGFHPIKQLVDFVEESTDKVATGAKNAYKLATNSLNAHSISNFVLLEGFRDLDGNIIRGNKSFIEAIKGVDLTNDETRGAFSEYLKLRHALEVQAKDKRVFADEVLSDPKNIKARLTKLNQAFPEFKKAAENLYEFQYNVLTEYAVKSGLMTQEQAEFLHDEYPSYVPFHRYMGDRKGMGGRKSIANQKSPIRRMKGSGLDTLDPLESIVRNTEKIIAASIKHQTADVLGQYADTVDGVGAFIERIPPDQVAKTIDITALKEEFGDRLQTIVSSSNDFFAVTDLLDEVFGDEVTGFNPVVNESKRIIAVQRGDERAYYQVHNEALFNSITELSPRQASGLLKFLTGSMGKLNALITQFNPKFSIFNPFRDIKTAYKLGAVDNPAKFIKGYANALRLIATGSEDYKQFKAMGGGHSSYINAELGTIAQSLKDLQMRDKGLARRAGYSFSFSRYILSHYKLLFNIFL